jgi:hypothetical protein
MTLKTLYFASLREKLRDVVPEMDFRLPLEIIPTLSCRRQKRNEKGLDHEEFFNDKQNYIYHCWSVLAMQRYRNGRR